MAKLKKTVFFCCGIICIISPLVRSVETSKQDKFVQWQDYSKNLCADSNLVAYYDFEQGMENTLKNKATGLYIGKDSPSQLDGICKGTVWTTGRWPHKGALGFDGINDYVDCGNNWGAITSEITIEIWLKKRGTDGARNMVVVSKGGNGLYSPYTISIDKGNSIYFLQQAKPNRAWDTFLYSQRVIADDRWHHIVVTNDLITAKIYIDGVLDDSEDFSPAKILNDNDVSLTIGAAINPLYKTIGQYFEGAIDEIAIYNRALTPKEIESHYTIGNPYKEKVADAETPYSLENVDFNANIIKNSGFEQSNDKDSMNIVPGWNINGDVKAFSSTIAITPQQKFKGQKALKINLEKEKYSFSINQEIAEVITSEYYLLSLSYKTNSRMPLAISLSSGPKGVPPNKTKQILTSPSNDWKQVSWPVKMFYREDQRKYLEILINSEIENATVLYLDEIKLVPLKLKPNIKMFSPQSGVIFDDLDTNKLSFISTYPIEYKNIEASLVSEKKTIDLPLCGKQFDLAYGTKYIFHVTVPLKLPLGEYLINITDKNKNLSSQFNLSKQHLEPPYTVVHNGAPYVDGKPFLTIGIYHASSMALNMINDGTGWGNDSSPGSKAMGLPLLTRREMLSSLADRGFNTVTWSSSDMPPEDFFATAEESGLMVWPLTSCNQQNQYARKFKNLLFWAAHDEVSAPRKYMEKEYVISRKLDPFRFVCGSTSSGRFSGSLGSIEDWSIFDIVAPDVYDIGGPSSHVDITYKVMVDTHKYIIKGDTRRSCFLIPQLFCGGGPYVPSNALYYGWSNGFEPTYEQVRAQIYTGIVGGAKGFFYYSYVATEKLVDGMSGNPKRRHWFLPESRLWEKIGELNAELLALKDAILLGQKSNSILVSSEKVRYSVKETADKIYLIAVNPFATEETLTYKINDSNLAFSPLFNSDPLFDGEGTMKMNKYGIGVWEAKK